MPSQVGGVDNTVRILSLDRERPLKQLSAQAPKAELPEGCLAGVRVFVAAGDEDEVAPVAMGEALLSACEKAGASCEPLHKYSGDHEVTLEVADAVKEVIDEL